MSRARDNANLGAQAGSGLDASDITSGALGASVTGGAGLAVSTATTTALGDKADKASPTFTGTVAIPNVANLEDSVVANTAKVTNATHSGDVTGATALTIANDAVDSQHYAADSIDTEHYAPASVDTTAMAASVIGVKPHIIPGVLYPSYVASGTSNTLLDGTTSHSGAFGTAQSDGRKYYYTNIAGSKPIKDPRIGAHFGSQRHACRSLQKLEQETATQGDAIFSIDGRDWMRANLRTVTYIQNDVHGTYVPLWRNTASYIEITGYFSSINLLCRVSANQSYKYSLDGATEVVKTNSAPTVNSPLGSRYVSAASLIEVGSTTLDLHTIRIQNNSTPTDTELHGIELIAQDTNNRNNIHIPSQNVVSYGKKFTVAGTPHYNPFATKGDDSASTIPNDTVGDLVADGWAGATSAYWDSSLDTATSLGLGAWETATDFYRPVNGGRVVKWVDSTGAIKTSVNMMPPEASSIAIFAAASGAGTCDATGTHNWSTQYLPQFGNKTIGSNLTTNGTFEADDNWGVQGSAVTSQARASDQKRTDNYSWKIVTSGTNSGIVQDTDSMFSVKAGKLYRFRCWVRCDQSTKAIEMGYLTTGCTGRFDRTQFMLHWTTANTWEEMDITLEATTSGTMRTRFMAQSSNITWWLDDFTVHEIEDPSLQAEVAKTFHFREFGNGSANGNATYADASMLNTIDDIAYVMDDGLTSLSAARVAVDANVDLAMQQADGTDFWYITFIGTGFTLKNTNSSGKTVTWCQNLPYGTHIIKADREGGTAPDIYIDGVPILDNASVNNYADMHEVTFHQPKMPPIPEDAVVIADYMLMADFVAQTASGIEKVSKGVRSVNASRDSLYDNTHGSGSFDPVAPQPLAMGGLEVCFDTTASANTIKQKLPFFGTNFVSKGYQHDNQMIITLDGVDKDSASTRNGDSNRGSYAHLTTDIALGVYEAGKLNTASTNPCYGNMDIATPIHTSSHYQTFETPFLHELVGGDRNMEQTNLVVTPDGKTWDEVTRDVSYIGNMLVGTTHDNSYDADADVNIWDYWRGTGANFRSFHNKDFAIAYDRLICLVDGQYQVIVRIYEDSAGHIGELKVNGLEVSRSYNLDTSGTTHNSMQVQLKRGDYVQVIGRALTYVNYNFLTISRV